MLRIINTGQYPIDWHGIDPSARLNGIFADTTMPKLKRGDSVSCRVSSAEIVGPYKSYDEIANFVIVAVDERGYYLFVPNYMLIKHTIVADKYRCKTLGIEDRFLNEEITYILEGMIASVDRKQGGCTCKVCNEMFPWAAANQEDGSLICYSCRQNPYR